MNSDQVRDALLKDRTIDITTTGRTSGKSHRVEIWFHNLDGRIYISGQPGRRDWYANLLAHPEFTFHLKESVKADLEAHARPVTDPAERQIVLRGLLERLGRDDDLNDWIARSPLVEVELANN